MLVYGDFVGVRVFACIDIDNGLSQYYSRQGEGYNPSIFVNASLGSQ
jgi:hypothetical protein